MTPKNLWCLESIAQSAETIWAASDRKTFAPTSPSRRQMTGINYREFLTRHDPEKSLVFGKQRAVGRNNLGRITTRHKGGGAKRLLRAVDFLFDKKDIPARVESVEYDPNRTAFIGLVVYKDGEKRYIVLPKDVRPGREILISEKAPILPGNRLPLGVLPPGTLIYNVALAAEGKAVLVRSAGSFAEIVAHDGGYATIKLPSDRKSTRLNSSHSSISYAVFCLKKK